MNKSIHSKYWLITYLLSVLCVVGINAQDLTPYPEGYLNEATKVDMSKAPDVFITRNGQRRYEE